MSVFTNTLFSKGAWESNMGRWLGIGWNILIQILIWFKNFVRFRCKRWEWKCHYFYAFLCLYNYPLKPHPSFGFSSKYLNFMARRTGYLEVHKELRCVFLKWAENRGRKLSDNKLLTTANVVTTQAVVYALVIGGICIYSCWKVLNAIWKRVKSEIS